MAYTILRGGRVLDIAAGTAEPADILIEDDTIREIGPPGLRRAAEGAVEIRRARRLIHPGLVNAHTHGHGNLAKGMGDRWTLELLLTAAPWISGNRSARGQLSVDPARRGRDGAEGLHRLLRSVLRMAGAEPPTGWRWSASAYAEVGMRAVIAPMVADRSFYEAIPGLADALPPALQEQVAELRLPPAEATLAAIRDGVARLVVRPRPGPPGGGADDPAPLLGRVHPRLRRPGPRVRCRTAQPCRRVEGAGGDRHPRSTAGPRPRISMRSACSGRISRWRTASGSTMTTWPGSATTAPRSRTIPAATCGSAAGSPMRGRCSSGGSISASAPTAPICSDNQNMYEAMRLASFVSKVQGPEWQRWLTTREAALAATEGSARVLGFGDRIGRIAPGYKADIVMLDLDHPNWLPLNDPVNQLVHSEDGTAVDSVMIGGRMVVDNRRVADRRSRPAARPRRSGARPARRRQRRQPPPLRGAGAGRRQLLPGPGPHALSRPPLRRAAGLLISGRQSAPAPA